MIMLKCPYICFLDNKSEPVAQEQFVVVMRNLMRKLLGNANANAFENPAQSKPCLGGKEIHF